MIERIWQPVDQHPWLAGGGPDGDLVLHTQVTLARNLAEYPFCGPKPAPRGGQSRAILNQIAEASRDLGEVLPLDTLNQDELKLLKERRLVSRQMAHADQADLDGAGLLVANHATAMINEQEHLVIQGIVPGLDLLGAYTRADQLEAELAGRLSFAFHPEFGYLTASIWSVGTGLQATVLLNVPGLIKTREMPRVGAAIHAMELSLQGWSPTQERVQGHLIRISNLATTGRSEADLLNHLGRAVRQVMAYEIRAREVALSQNGSRLEDECWRAWGLLTNARVLEMWDCLGYISLVKVGLTLGFGIPTSVPFLTRLMNLVQPANLVQLSKCRIEGSEAIREYRAEVVREALQQKGWKR